MIKYILLQIIFSIVVCVFAYIDAVKFKEKGKKLTSNFLRYFCYLLAGGIYHLFFPFNLKGYQMISDMYLMITFFIIYIGTLYSCIFYGTFEFLGSYSEETYERLKKISVVFSLLGKNNTTGFIFFILLTITTLIFYFGFVLEVIS